MTTITVNKTQLKSAYTGDIYYYSQERTEDIESGIDFESLLLKIMLDNYKPTNNQKEAG